MVRLGVMALCLAGALVSFAQTPVLSSPPERKSKKKHDADRSGPKPSIAPSVTIPVTPLGFASPASYYLGRRVAQVSLGFLDEDHLLFTFRVPGLIPREAESDNAQTSQERRIRALVLALPTGQVTAEAVWSVHDQKRYLWMLKDGHFLLRDRNLISRGDSGLTLEPFLRFPGDVDYLELDPAQKLLVTDTTEAPAAGVKSSSIAPQTPPTADAAITLDDQQSSPQSQALLRILRMDTRAVELFSRVTTSVHLPVDGEGYYEALRSRAQSWEITHQSFRGSAALLSRLDSVCSPMLDAVSPGSVLVTSCLLNGDYQLTLLTQQSQRLWVSAIASTRVWPLLVTAPDARRFARSTLELSRPISSGTPIEFDDLKGQSVLVYDLANGKVVLSAPTTPILDGGGNFALSPSGRRFAALNDGAIQVFDLPPAPPIPAPPAS